jgi:hypothetical protein
MLTTTKIILINAHTMPSRLRSSIGRVINRAFALNATRTP